MISKEKSLFQLMVSEVPAHGQLTPLLGSPGKAESWRECAVEQNAHLISQKAKGEHLPLSFQTAAQSQRQTAEMEVPSDIL